MSSVSPWARTIGLPPWADQPAALDPPPPPPPPPAFEPFPGAAAIGVDGQRCAVVFYARDGIPKTEALLEQKLNSLDPVYQWWFECLRRGSVHISGADWYPFVKTRTALTSYQIHCEKTGIRFPLPDNQLAQMIKNKLAPGSARVRRTVMEDGVHSRAWGYTMPGLDECRAHFEDMIGHPMDWGCDETA